MPGASEQAQRVKILNANTMIARNGRAAQPQR
jgi:hypothetical protein